MAAIGTSVKVTSNVARDILQSAAVFRNLATVVWEYVANSLQYVDQNVCPKVVVNISSSKRTVAIGDNGAGMDRQGLKNFFTMHGHNQDRLRGKAGRGMFGTGKSAAFGIAETLTIRTIRNGLRNTLSLSRSAIQAEEAKGNVTEVPVQDIEVDVPTSESNGTLVTIEGISVKCDVPSVVTFIERHLGRGFKDAEVVVNGQEVEYLEPSYSQEFKFNPEGQLLQSLGNVELIVRVSGTPLDSDYRGIDITSSGVLFETTLGSSEGKELSQYIFGQLDVPELINQGQAPVPAFNMTRDMKLNAENPLVRDIHAFISVKVETVRRQLIEADRKRRETEDARRLQRQADEIAKLLNTDFTEYADKIQRIKSTISSVAHDRGSSKAAEVGKGEKKSIFGGDESVEVLTEDGGPGSTSTVIDGPGPAPPNPNPKPTPKDNKPTVEPRADGDPLGKPAEVQPSKKPSRGGFHVDFRNTGVENNRATYESDNRTIVVNLDFPQIAEALKKDGIDSLTFQRLANEVAITEYAIAISSELVNSEFYNDPSDYIFEIRNTVNRINRRAASPG